MTALGDLIAPCGPVIDEPAAGRLHDQLFEGVDGAGGAKRLALAWPALAPIFAASPYLAGLARRDPRRLARLLAGDADTRLEAILKAAHALGEEPGVETVERGLRDLKAELHLLTALADLGGVWDLDRVTGALSRFADAAVTSALALAAGEALAAGRLTAWAKARLARCPACSSSPWASTARSNSTIPATSTSRSSTTPAFCLSPPASSPRASPRA